MRNVNTHVVYAVGQEPELFLGRGYTGHEHLPWFGLINMNARLYDPVHGRFLAPDPYVRAPDFTQSFNRYSYAWGNPLIYTDPNGDWFLIDDLIAGLIGGVINLGYQLLTGNVSSFGQGLAYFGVGFVSGVAFEYGGPIVSGMIAGAGNTLIQGGSLIDIAKGALIGGIAGGIAQIGGQLASQWLSSATRITGGIIGGVVQGAAAGVSAGFTAGTLGSLANGENISNSLKFGLKSAVLGGALGEGIGGAFGGISSYVNKQNILTGKPITKTGSVIVEQLLDDGLYNSVNRDPSKLGHIFDDRSGHVNPKTLASQERYISLFEKVANNPNNLITQPVLREFIPIQAYNAGVQVYAQTFNLEQVWVFVRHGIIYDAGVNVVPR